MTSLPSSLNFVTLTSPVLITKTKGFWDEEIENNEHIFFVNQNNLTLWRERIQNILFDTSLLEDVSSNSKKIINKKYSIKKFTEELVKYLN